MTSLFRLLLANLFALLCFSIGQAQAAAVPVAEYRFDDVAWCTPVTVKDSLATFDGTLIGGIGWQDSPAAGGKPVNGAAAGFSGGAVDITGLPLDLAPGATNSVSFWMFWDGTNSVMPVGFGLHDLWLQGGSFGFNTFNSDVFGISSAGLAGGWHHVAAVFTNGNVAANQLWIDGVAQVLTQRSTTPNNANAIASTHLRLSGVWGNGGYQFSGLLDVVRVYSGSIIQAQVDGDRALTYPAVVCPPPPPPTLVAQYRLDDDWDTTHVAVNAVSAGPAGVFLPSYASKVATPKVAPNKPNTCSGVSFATGNGSMRSTGVSLDLNAGGKNSVSFWMYWNGGDSQMPFGFARHDLWLQNGSFGFNSGSGDIHGISSAGLANGWHHVAAVFTNGSIPSNKLWIDGVPQVLTQRQGTPNNATSYAANTFQLNGWANDGGYRFIGSLDELKVYRGALTDTLVGDDYTTGCVVAGWHMDEASWSGTAGEVEDAGGNGFNGTGTNGATTSNALPRAINGSPGTCAYGVFDGGDDYVALPATFPNLTSDFTITAWIRTTNNARSGQRIFIDDQNNTGGYGVSLGDGGSGRLRFYTRSISPIILDAAVNTIQNNLWYFVAAVADITNKTRTLYVYDQSGVLLSTVTQTFTGTWGTDVGAASIGGENNASGETGTAFHFAGNLDEVTVHVGALTSGELTAVMRRSRTCSGIVPVVPANFNCVETGADALTGHLYTKLAGAPFGFDVVALRAGPPVGVEIDYASDVDKNVTVELVDGSGVTACASRVAISPAVSQTLTFSKLNQPLELGRKAAASMTVSKAYPDLRCRVTDANQSPSVVGCSADNFAVRPSAASLATSASAAAPSIASAPMIRAGTNFTLSATTSVGSSYSGTLSQDASKLTAQISTQASTVQAGGVVGTLTPSSLTANAAAVSASYSEVGYLYLAPGAYRDEAFTAVDSSAGDCITSTVSDGNLADTLSGDKYGCHIGNKTAVSFGRFIPDHFTVTPGVVLASCLIHPPAAGAYVPTDFSYFGQDGFTTPFTLTAQNSANGTTLNYMGVFAKLDLTNYSSFGFSAATLPAGSSLSSSATAPSGTWAAGVASVTAKHQLGRPTAPTGETSITVSAAPTDGEVPVGASAAVGGASKFRYGRLRLGNAYGSELLNLPIPLEAQYWDAGGYYVPSRDDSCTAFDTSSIFLSGFTQNLAACETQLSPTGLQTFTGGTLPLRLSRPGAGNNGSVSLTLNISNVATGNTCVAPAPSAATAANLPWFGANPTGLATFGVYKSPLIYRRENF